MIVFERRTRTHFEVKGKHKHADLLNGILATITESRLLLWDVKTLQIIQRIDFGCMEKVILTDGSIYVTSQFKDYRRAIRKIDLCVKNHKIKVALFPETGDRLEWGVTKPSELINFACKAIGCDAIYLESKPLIRTSKNRVAALFCFTSESNFDLREHQRPLPYSVLTEVRGVGYHSFDCSNSDYLK